MTMQLLLLDPPFLLFNNHGSILTEESYNLNFHNKHIGRPLLWK